MASWRDGAEYAPVERPDGFATPVVDPIEQVASVRAATPGPTPPPINYMADTSAAPICEIGIQVKGRRDPQLPFAVTSASLTAESSWSGSAAQGGPFDEAGFDPTKPMGQYLETTQMTFSPPNADPYQPATQLPYGYPMPGPAPFNTQMYGSQPDPRSARLTPAKIQLLWVAAGLLALGWYNPTSGIWFLTFAAVMASLSHRTSAILICSGLALSFIVDRVAAPYQSAQVQSVICAALAVVEVGIALGLRRQNGWTPPPGPDQWGNQP